LIRPRAVKFRMVVAVATLASLCACSNAPVACTTIGYMAGISVDVAGYAPATTVEHVQACWAGSCHDYIAAPVRDGVALATTYDLPDNSVDVTVTLGGPRPLTGTVSAVPVVKFKRGPDCGGDLRGLDLAVAADGSVGPKG
jgi:hypothetical protein